MLKKFLKWFGISITATIFFSIIYAGIRIKIEDDMLKARAEGVTLYTYLDSYAQLNNGRLPQNYDEFATYCSENYHCKIKFYKRNGVTPLWIYYNNFSKDDPNAIIFERHLYGRKVFVPVNGEAYCLKNGFALRK